MNYAEILRKHKAIDLLSKGIAGLKYGSDIVLVENEYFLKISSKIKSKKTLKEVTVSRLFKISLQPLKIPTIKEIEKELTQSINEYYD
jgi:hypothetical protein